MKTSDYFQTANPLSQIQLVMNFVSHYLILISIFFKLTKYRIMKVLQGCSTVFYYANMLSILSKKCSLTKSTSNNVKKKFFVRCRFGPFPSIHPIYLKQFK